ncbi:hypothetical protein RI367_005512 [Sorochytrium milnesiophthora]
MRLAILFFACLCAVVHCVQIDEEHHYLPPKEILGRIQVTKDAGCNYKPFVLSHAADYASTVSDPPLVKPKIGSPASQNSVVEYLQAGLSFIPDLGSAANWGIKALSTFLDHMSNLPDDPSAMSTEEAVDKWYDEVVNLRHYIDYKLNEETLDRLNSTMRSLLRTVVEASRYRLDQEKVDSKLERVFTRYHDKWELYMPFKEITVIYAEYYDFIRPFTTQACLHFVHKESLLGAVLTRACGRLHALGTSDGNGRLRKRVLFSNGSSVTKDERHAQKAANRSGTASTDHSDHHHSSVLTRQTAQLDVQSATDICMAKIENLKNHFHTVLDDLHGMTERLEKYAVPAIRDRYQLFNALDYNAAAEHFTSHCMRSTSSDYTYKNDAVDVQSEVRKPTILSLRHSTRGISSANCSFELSPQQMCKVTAETVYYGYDYTLAGPSTSCPPQVWVCYSHLYNATKSITEQSQVAVDKYLDQTFTPVIQRMTRSIASLEKQRQELHLFEQGILKSATPSALPDGNTTKPEVNSSKDEHGQQADTTNENSQVNDDETSDTNGDGNVEE